MYANEVYYFLFNYSRNDEKKIRYKEKSQYISERYIHCIKLNGIHCMMSRVLQKETSYQLNFICK